MAYHRIIPRAEWGAQHDAGAGPRALPCRELWGHHTVTIAPDVLPPFDDDYAAIRALERIGESRFKRGISYTFLFTPAGLVFEGHGVDRIGSHTGGRNTTTAGLAFVGNFEEQEPTPAALEACAWLVAHGFLNGWWDAALIDGGHRDLKATACPGFHLYRLLNGISARAKAIVDEVVHTPVIKAPPAPPAPAGKAVSYDWTRKPVYQLRDPYMTGAFVRQIQTFLKAVGFNVKVDGAFGPNTRDGVKGWQMKLGFRGRDVDGKWGPGTQGATDRFLAFIGAA